MTHGDGEDDDEEVLRRHFIAVATGSYDDSASFPALDVAGEVEAFERWLCAADLGKRAFTRVALGPDPTKTMIETALSPAAAWTPQDAVAVYVTGHGFIRGGTHWIATRRTLMAQPTNSAIPTAHLVGRLIESDLDHLLIIVDVCFAGEALGPLRAAVEDWKPTWLVLASTARNQMAGVGVLARAVCAFLEEARGSRKYNHAPYFAASEFVNGVDEQLPPDQRLSPLQDRLIGRRANLCLPNPDWVAVPAAGPAIRAEELAGHWSPRSRGVARDAEPGWFFTGRPLVMRRILDFVAGPPGRLLVTGGPGSGKSAVLGRLVTLADEPFTERYATSMAAVERDLRPALGAVDAAVLATGKLANQVLGQICAAVGVQRSPGGDDVPGVEQLLKEWREWLGTHDRVVTVVVDALDEADNPAALAEKVLAGLDPPNGPRRVRLLVAVRSPGGEAAADAVRQEPEPRDVASADADPAGGAPSPVVSSRGLRPGAAVSGDAVSDTAVSGTAVSGTAVSDTVLVNTVRKVLGAQLLSLDRPPYADPGDIAELVRSILIDTDGSPYRSATVGILDQVVAQIVQQAGASYLLARSAAASLAARDAVVEPGDGAWLAELRDDVIGIVRGEIARKAAGPEKRERIVHLLRAVAFGHGAGIPWAGVWAPVATAIAQSIRYGDRDIEDLLTSALAGYLVTDREDGITTYRIADETVRRALREQWWLLAGTPPPAEPEPVAEVEARIAEALAPRRASFRRRLGPLVPEYVRRHLVEHAAAGGVLGWEIVPDWFLPQVDPTRLREADPRADMLPLSATVRRVAHRWDWHRPRFNAAALRMFRALYGAPLPEASFDDDWVVRWASPSRDLSEILGLHRQVGSVAAVSVDGRTIAVTGGADGLRVWDLAGGPRVGVAVAGIPQKVSALAVVAPPEGGPLALVAGADADGVWTVDLTAAACTGRLAIAQAGRPCVVAASVTADGRTLVVTGDRRGRVAFWDLSTGALVGEAADGHRGPVTAVAVLPGWPREPAGSALAVSAGDDGTVRLWDPATAGAVGDPMTGHRGPVSSLAVAVLGGRPVAVTGGFDETVRVWDLVEREQRGMLEGHDGAVWAVSTVTLPDGRAYAVSCAEDPALRVWDLEAPALHDDSMQSRGRPIAALATVVVDTARAGAIQPDAIEPEPERGLAVTAGRDGVIRAWPLTVRASSAQPRSTESAQVKRDRVSSLALGRRPDGSVFAVTGSAADEAVVRTLGGDGRGRGGGPAEVLLRGHSKPVSAVRTAERADGATVVITAAWDGTLRLWDPVEGQQLGPELSGHRGPVLVMDIVKGADGRLLAVSGGLDGTIRFWDLERPSLLATVPFAHGHERITAVGAARLRDGRAVAVTGTSDGRLSPWDAESGRPLRSFGGGNSREPCVRGHRGAVRALAATVLDERTAVVVSGGDDGVVRAWDLERVTPIGRRMTGHVGQVAAVATGTLDGGRLVALTGGDDEAVRVWDLLLGVPLGVELPTPGPVRALAVQGESPVLRVVAAGNEFLAVADRRSSAAGAI